ncbi:DUF6443 domain-containing protein [Puia dinghuensis]|uniref:DUF6443 domain-containing protein n=1 Tax=Puia dinghuensis TaxID=1792502 RepID=A0A8J2XRQ5_9BACT|nr:DUF6443 domain-containing protein [Puia dinghuensis]GGA87918.1 hypothetical protein GCM10011511_08800 [Puia dinghuensis]
MKRFVLLPLYVFSLAVAGFGQGNIPNGATGPASATPKPTSTYYYPAVSPLYFRTLAPKMPIQDTSKVKYTTIVDSVLISTQYSDPLGRPYETIAKQASPSKKDFVAAAVYDEFSRPASRYLPFAEQSGNTNDGLFKLTPIADDSAFYKSQIPGEQIYYGQTTYDASPLQRTVKTTAPGNSWTGAGVGVGYSWRANNTGDSVRLWTIPIAAENDLATTTTTYQPGSLQVAQVTDERGVNSLVYVDDMGRKVLTKTQAVPSPGTGHVGWLCTYYVYDEMNHLRMMLPPKAVAALNTSAINWSLTADATINQNLCYSYFYDSRGRVTMKRIPGKGKTYVVYDVFDRPVFAQDSALRNLNEWTGTLYDGQSRPLISGLLTYAATEAQLQALVTTQTGSGTSTTIILDSSITANLTLNNNPTTGSYQASSSIGLASGFGVPSGSTFSGTIATGGGSKNSVTLVGSPLPSGAPFSFLAVLYYDNYNWLEAQPVSGLDSTLITTNITSANFNLTYNTAPDYAQSITACTRTRGAVTGIKRLVVGKSTYLYTVNIYDDHGRQIQSKQANYTGGTDVATTQYGFTGLLLRTHVAHGKGGFNAQTHTLLTVYSYDHVGRLLSVAKSLDGATSKTVSQNTYNELGQLRQKVYGSSIETQAYAYNMRGWLLGINSSYVSTSGSTSNYFGETLAYDYGFTSAQLNGNMAGVMWKAAGDGVARAYGYSYDSVNRLTGANFTQQDPGSSSWAKDLVDYTVSGLAYDGGGNITSLMQKGLVDGKPATVDSLSYNYFTNSNQLQKVSEGSSVTTPLGDFKDTSYAGNHYAYDANGNTTIDYNRHMVTAAGGNGAVYNFLNKPDSIVLNGRAGIHYVYDAGGMQLAKQVNDYTTGHLVGKTYQYVGPFVYLNDTLQYVLQEEGQIRNARKVNSSTGAIYYAFEYDYFIKDHQGNVRTILTEGSDTATYAATMESKDSAVVAATFSDVYSPVYTVWPKPSGFDTDTSNHNVAMLNPANGGPQVGPSIVLKVMRGDNVQLSTYAFYNTAVQAPQSGINLLSNILSVLGTGVISANTHLAAGDLTGVDNALNPNVTQFLNNGRSYDSTRPKAYLNWILFDDQFNYVAGNSGVVQVTPGSSKQALVAPTQSISKNGYLYVYVSNESPQNVYFDNLTVKQMTGPLQQEQSYYPFGLPMAGISDKALLKSNTPYKANVGTELEEDYGLEYYNTWFRKYDPQIGRFGGVDMLGESTAGLSPYHFSGNNPVSYVDPMGLQFRLPNPNEGGVAGPGGNEFDPHGELESYEAEWGINGWGWGGGGGGTRDYSAYWENLWNSVPDDGAWHLFKADVGADVFNTVYNYANGSGSAAFETPNYHGFVSFTEGEDYMYQGTTVVSGLPENFASDWGTGGFRFGGMSGPTFRFEDKEEEEKPIFGLTYTNKAIDEQENFNSVLWGSLKHSFFAGKVTGKEGYITVDFATANNKFEGASFAVGPLTITFSSEYSISIGLGFNGSEGHLSAGLGNGYGQVGVGWSRTSEGNVEGQDWTYDKGIGNILSTPIPVIGGYAF